MTIWTKDWGGRQRKGNKLKNAYYPAGSKDERMRGGKGEHVERSEGKQSDRQTQTSERARGVARIFQRGGHTVSKWGYSPYCHYGQGIVMASSPPVVGCLVKKGLQKGWSRAPQDLPWLRPCEHTSRANAGWLGSFKKSIILYRLLVCGPSVKLDRHVCRNEQHNPEYTRNKFIHKRMLKYSKAMLQGFSNLRLESFFFFQ